MSKHGHSQGSAGEVKESGDLGLKPEEGEVKNAPPEAGTAESCEKAQSSETPEKPETAAGPLSLEEKYADLESKMADLNDQYLRKAADFENFRKRTMREKQELADFANQNLLLDLLPIIDDFERAIKSSETSKDFASFYEGITMIEKRLSTQLENKWGLKRFDSAGEPFDPNRHEAIQMEKAEGVTEAVVKDDFVKGYLLKDRVIRFAKVKVLMPADAGLPAGEASGAEPKSGD